MTDGLSSFGIFDALDVAYFEVDLKGIVSHCNQAFLDKSEAQLHQVIGRHFRHMMPSKQAADLFGVFREIYETRQTRRFLFTFIQQKSGGIRTAEGIAGPVKSADEKVIAFRGILFDVTERVKEEMELLSAKQAAEKELAIGKAIQASFLPSYLPALDGWSLDVHFQSAREVAGDFYDVFSMSNGARLGFVIADVCDKGVGAAMYMATFRTLIRAFANIKTGSKLTQAVEETSQRVNDNSLFRSRSILSVGAHPLVNAISMTNEYFVLNHGNSNMFSTVFFGVLNPFDGKLLYINAGHESPLVLSNGRVTQRLEPTGPAVGLMPGMSFEIGSADLSHGDLLILYTDGVLDARNEKGEPFGEDRLLELSCNFFSAPRQVVGKIAKSLESHMSAQEQFDDITLMGIYRH